MELELISLALNLKFLILKKLQIFLNNILISIQLNLTLYSENKKKNLMSFSIQVF